MEAGTELDALVAEKVMGCNLRRPYEGIDRPGITYEEFLKARNYNTYACKCTGQPHQFFSDDGNVNWLKEYSTDIAAAWEVVKEITSRGIGFTFDFDESDEEVRAHFRSQAPAECGYHEEVGGLRFLPHAICLAALRSVGVDI